MNLNDTDVNMGMNDESMLEMHNMNLNGQYNNGHHQHQQSPMHQQNSLLSVSGLNGYPNGFPPGAVPIAGYPGYPNNLHANNGHAHNNGLNSMDLSSIEKFAEHVGVKVEQLDDINTFNNGVGTSQSSQNTQNTSFSVNEQDITPHMEALYDRARNLQHGNSNHQVGSMTLPAGIGSGFINYIPPQNLAMNQNLIAAQQQANSIAAFESGQNIDTQYNNNAFVFDQNTNPTTTSFPGNIHAQSGQHPGMQVMHPSVVHHMPGVGPGDFGSQTLPSEIFSGLNKNDPASTVSIPGYEFNPLRADEQAAQEKEERSRLRNRDHSRKSRLRKKEMVSNLLEENKLLKEIFEQCADLVALVSKEASAIFMYASSSYARTLGYTSAHIVAGQSSFYDLVHPDNIADVRMIFQQLTTVGETKRFQFRIKAIDGQYYVANTASRVSEKGVVCTTRVEKES